MWKKIKIQVFKNLQIFSHKINPLNSIFIMLQQLSQAFSRRITKLKLINSYKNHLWSNIKME